MKFQLISVFIVLLSGCAHQSVRIDVKTDSENTINVHEELRPWPVTINSRFSIVLPAGHYDYTAADYDLQTNLPEKPVKTIRYSDVRLVQEFDHGFDKRTFDGGWIAIYRNIIEIRLLTNGVPDTCNGVYDVTMPCVKPK